MKPTVYIESSVISYFTARPSRNVVVAGHQATTRDFWEGCPNTKSTYPEDALHIAIAAVHSIDRIVTWNFKHINNPATRSG